MKTATVRARVEPELKLSVEGVLTSLGLSISEAIELYMHQIELHQGIPFAVRIPHRKTKKTSTDTGKGKI